MEVKLKTAQAKPFFRFFDQDKNLIQQVEKTVQTNLKGEPVVRLEQKDIPTGSRYVQCVAEIEGRLEEHQLLCLDVIESPSQSKREEGITLIGTFPAPPHPGIPSRRLLQVYDLLIRLAEEDEQKSKGQPGEVSSNSMAEKPFNETVEPAPKKRAKKKLPEEKTINLEPRYYQEPEKESNKLEDNLRWNLEHHHLFLERIKPFSVYLTEAEDKAIKDLLQANKWGHEELEQVKQIVETAKWAEELKSGATDKNYDDICK